MMLSLSGRKHSQLAGALFMPLLNCIESIKCEIFLLVPHLLHNKKVKFKGSVPTVLTDFTFVENIKIPSREHSQIFIQ